VVLNDISELPGGATGYAQLRSSIPMAATHGQRFILRDENASRTVGGGEILYVAARRFARNRRGEDAFLDTLRHGSDEQRVECVLTAAGFDSLAPLRISALTAVPVGRIESIIADLTESKKLQSIGGSDVRVTNDAINMLAERLNRWLRNHHQRNPDAPGCAADTVVGWLERKSAHGLGRILLDRYLAEGAVKQRGRFVCLPEFAPAMSAQDERLMTLMLDEFRNNRFQPPSPAELGNVMSAKPPRVRKLIEIALASEELVRIDNDMLLHAETEVELREKVATVIKSSNGATVGEIRETLNTTRKYVVPLLEYLDRVGITRRDGDRRFLNHQAAETVDGSKPEVSS
jgi:selenocysteine-specific elongation factor